MRNVKRSQMEIFEGSTLKELKENFNKSMEWVSRFADKEEERKIDLTNLRGYVIYTESVRLPENYRDRLELEHIRLTCGNCKYFEHIKYNWGACPFCKGDLRSNDECCDRFYDEWEHNGECWAVEGDTERLERIVKTTDLEKVRKAI